MPSRSTSGYRNHARFTIGPGGTLGYVNNTTRTVPSRVDRCDLMHPWINDALAHLQERCAETTQLSVRYGVNTGEYLVQPRLVGSGIELESGQKHYTETMLGQRFRVASPSFFQVNTPTAEAMVELVGEQLRLEPSDLLVDAYAGVGVFARLLADRCRRVIAIEESSAAVKDARVNAEDSANVEFRLGKTEDVLPTLEETPDALILDPSRAGCDRRALDAVLRLGPRRVAYVSCEPDALARDLAVLVEGGYRVEMVQPVDLFPYTHHIECIAVLSRDGSVAAPALTLASASPRRRELLQLLGVDYDVTVSGVDETPREGEDTPERLAAVAGASKGAGRRCRAVVRAGARRGHGGRAGRRRVREARGRTGGRGDAAGASGEDAYGGHGRGRRRRRDWGERRPPSTPRASPCGSTRTQKWRRTSPAGNPMDKAGAYAAQDPGFHPAAAIDGCWTNAIGLPLCRVRSLLAEHGVATPLGADWGSPGACTGCASIPEQGWPLQ